MVTSKRIFLCLLSFLLLSVFMIGCAGSNDDRCVKVEGSKVSLPSLGLTYEFPDPWFIITKDELSAIGKDKTQLENYIDGDGNLLVSRPESYSADSVILFNAKTLEVCSINITEDTKKYSLESFVSETLYDAISPKMSEISLVQSLKLGKHQAYAISAITSESSLHYKYYYIHENDTFLEIITTGYSDHVAVEKLIEDRES